MKIYIVQQLDGPVIGVYTNKRVAYRNRDIEVTAYVTEAEVNEDIMTLYAIVSGFADKTGKFEKEMLKYMKFFNDPESDILSVSQVKKGYYVRGCIKVDRFKFIYPKSNIKSHLTKVLKYMTNKVIDEKIDGMCIEKEEVYFNLDL